VQTLNDPEIRLLQARLTVEEQENAVSDASQALQDSCQALQAGTGTQQAVSWRECDHLEPSTMQALLR
jgi:hypothetical protein